MSIKSGLIIEFSDVGREDIEQVGKEAADFGEIAKLGIPVPKGFIITTNAYREFFLANREIPENLVKKIFIAYKNLDSPLRDANVVVGSSFSKKKFKNVKGEANLMQKIRLLWDMYSDGIPAVLVYKIPESIQPVTMVTIDPIRNDKKIIVINEEDDGNQYEVSKHDLKIINKVIKKRSGQRLTDKQIIELATWGKKLQDHYYFPQEVEFAIENNHKIYLTKTKPLTTMGAKYLTEDLQKAVGKTFILQAYIPKNLKNIHKILVSGNPIHPGIATGHLRIIRKPIDVNKLKTGDIAVIANSQNLKLSEVERKAKAIIIEDRLYHLPHRLYSRTLGKPMIITMSNSSRGLKEGIVATVNGTNGEVYL